MTGPTEVGSAYAMPTPIAPSGTASWSASDTSPALTNESAAVTSITYVDSSSDDGCFPWPFGGTSG
jgi:hypothetical protein